MGASRFTEVSIFWPGHKHDWYILIEQFPPYQKFVLLGFKAEKGALPKNDYVPAYVIGGTENPQEVIDEYWRKDAQ